MNRKTTFILVSVVIVMMGTSLYLVFGSKHAEACSGSSKTYSVTIKNDKPSVRTIQAHSCDRIVFKNMDKKTREIAFGQHDKHTSYDGVSEHVLNQGESFSVVLDKAGDYHWHDHNQDEVEGYFTVE